MKLCRYCLEPLPASGSGVYRGYCDESCYSLAWRMVASVDDAPKSGKPKRKRAKFDFDPAEVAALFGIPRRRLVKLIADGELSSDPSLAEWNEWKVKHDLAEKERSRAALEKITRCL